MKPSKRGLDGRGEPQSPKLIGRRKLFKVLASAGGVATGAALVPSEWTRPFIKAITLPAHAQMSGVTLGARLPPVPGPGPAPGRNLLNWLVPPAQAQEPTFMPPTNTPIPVPTPTSMPPTNTPVPTATGMPPTNTPIPPVPTSTGMPPTNTPSSGSINDIAGGCIILTFGNGLLQVGLDGPGFNGTGGVGLNGSSVDVFVGPYQVGVNIVNGNGQPPSMATGDVYGSDGSLPYNADAAGANCVSGP